MDTRIATPDEVADAIQQDIADHLQITIAEAAKRIGKKPQTLYNILRGKGRISLANARLLHKEFGYSQKYMTSGEGNLREEDSWVLTIEPGTDRASKFVLGPEQSVIVDGVYYPRQRVKSPREQLLQVYCKLFVEIIRALCENGKIDVNLDELDKGPSFKDLGFSPQTSVEGELFNSLVYYRSQIDQLVDLRRIAECLNSLKEEGG